LGKEIEDQNKGRNNMRRARSLWDKAGNLSMSCVWKEMDDFSVISGLG